MTDNSSPWTMTVPVPAEQVEALADALETAELADLARRLIELTQEGNESAVMSLLRRAAGVDD